MLWSTPSTWNQLTHINDFLCFDACGFRLERPHCRWSCCARYQRERHPRMQSNSCHKINPQDTRIQTLKTMKFNTRDFFDLIAAWGSLITTEKMVSAKLRIKVLGGPSSHFVVNNIERIAPKLRRIILLHFENNSQGYDTLFHNAQRCVCRVRPSRSLPAARGMSSYVWSLGCPWSQFSLPTPHWRLRLV